MRRTLVTGGLVIALAALLGGACGEDEQETTMDPNLPADGGFGEESPATLAPDGGPTVIVNTFPTTPDDADAGVDDEGADAGAPGEVSP